MPFNEILLIIIGGGLFIGMLYIFVSVLLSPASRRKEAKTPPAETNAATSKKTRAGK